MGEGPCLPSWRQPSMRLRSVSESTRSATRKSSTARRKPSASNCSGTASSGTKHPSGRNAPSAASTCTCGLKFARSPKVCTNRISPGPGAGQRLAIRFRTQPRGDAAKLTEPRPVLAEDRAQEPRQGKDVLTVRRGLEDVLLDPLAVEQHALSGGSSGRSTGSCRSTRAGSRARRRRTRCGQSRDADRRTR